MVEVKVKTFRDLKVWQKAHKVVLEIYKITKDFPREEKYGLISQLRRSASSVPTNIVEGHKRRSRKEYIYFLNMADSSLEEMKYHIILSKDLDYIKNVDFDRLTEKCDEVGKMLFGLQKSLTS